MEQIKIENNAFLAALDKFNNERNIENQNKLIYELGKSRFLVPVDVKGGINGGRLEKNTELMIRILADDNGSRYYAVFTDWGMIRSFTQDAVDAVVLSYKEIRKLIKNDKQLITGILVNPNGMKKDFLMTERIMEDIDARLAKIKYSRKAVLFDLDGTLADSVESIAYSANRALESVGLKANPVENYKRYAGDGADTMLKRSLIDAGDSELVHYDEVRKKYRELFKLDCMYNVKPYSGINELLNELKQNGIKLAVLSNKPHERAVDVVEGLFGKDFFDIIIGQSEDMPKKPAPDGAILIAQKLGVSVFECVYVGDTNTDMQTGKGAKMLTVGVTWGFRDKEELLKNGADVIADKPKEILKLM